MSNLRLYPEVKVKRQSFVGHKVHTLPQQAMSLREIILRFTRKESLPVEKQGVYIDNMGDLEKAQHLDITEKYERAEAMREKADKYRKVLKDREEAAKKALESPPPAPTPPGVVTGSAGSGQAPAPSTKDA